MSRSPRTTASEGKKEKKKHKKEKKHKDGKHHRKSQPPGSIEPVPSKPTLVASNRDPLGVNLSEAELLLRTLNDLSLLPPSTPSPPISSPAIAKVLFAAIDADRVDLALALVVLGADINSLHSTRGITVLALAAEKGDNDAIKALSEAGALQKVPGASESPIEAAQRMNHAQSTRLLKSLPK